MTNWIGKTGNKITYNKINNNDLEKRVQILFDINAVDCRIPDLKEGL